MSKLDTSAHSLNNSTSKMTYSFPKSNRFLPSIKPTYLHYKLRCDLFYDVPLQRSKRSTSFGIGNKMSMSIDTDAPPPGTYTQASDFEGKNKKRGFSFGYGRDVTSVDNLGNSWRTTRLIKAWRWSTRTRNLSSDKINKRTCYFIKIKNAWFCTQEKKLHPRARRIWSSCITQCYWQVCLI